MRTSVSGCSFFAWCGAPDSLDALHDPPPGDRAVGADEIRAPPAAIWPNTGRPIFIDAA